MAIQASIKSASTPRPTAAAIMVGLSTGIISEGDTAGHLDCPASNIGI
jgi:hypothetical protein